MSILQEIITHKITELAQLKKTRPLKSFINDVEPSVRDFKAALKTASPALIAEIKQASPSEGVIRPNLDNELADIIKIYSAHTAAISVLTDEHFFQGSFDRLRRVRAMTNLPLLAKDFIIDEYQIYQAREAGADAILLIVAVIKESKILNHLINLARQLNMACLVEIRTRDEIKTALESGAEIIGINNRDLSTFDVNIDTTLNLLKYIPLGITTVSESGFHTAADIRRVIGKVNAVLIGTELMRSDDIKATVRSLGFA